MNYTGSAPVRQPVPELPVHDLPVPLVSEDPPKRGADSILYLRLFWMQRRLLLRFAFIGFFAGALLAWAVIPHGSLGPAPRGPSRLHLAAKRG